MAKQTEVIKIENIEAQNLINVSQWEEAQNKIVKDNPFIKIIDNATYIQAKANRTNLLKGRTSLLGVNGQEGIIKKRFKIILTDTVDVLKKLANVTEPCYDEQQTEVKRYEAILEEKRNEKIRLAEEERLKEEKRKEDINNKINKIYKTTKEVINLTVFNKIKTTQLVLESLKNDTNVEEFEEFEVTFYKVIENLELDLEEKINLLQEDENRRLEQVKLDEERAEFEKQKEKERIEKEKLQKITDAKQEKIDTENQVKKDKIAKELEEIRIEKERLAKIESDRVAADKKIKEAADLKKKIAADKKRVAELKPDIEKLTSIIDAIGIPTSEIPNLLDEKALDFLGNIQSRIKSLKAELLTELNGVK